MYEDTLQSYTQGNHPTIFLRERTYIGRDSEQYWSASKPILLRPVTYIGRNSDLYRFAFLPPRLPPLPLYRRYGEQGHFPHPKEDKGAVTPALHHTHKQYREHHRHVLYMSSSEIDGEIRCTFAGQTEFSVTTGS